MSKETFIHMNYSNYTHIFFHPTVNVEFNPDILYYLFKQMMSEGMKSYENIYVVSVLSPGNICLITRIKHAVGCMNTCTPADALSTLFRLFRDSVATRDSDVYDFYTYEDKKINRTTVCPGFSFENYEDTYVIKTLTLVFRPNRGVLRLAT